MKDLVQILPFVVLIFCLQVVFLRWNKARGGASGGGVKSNAARAKLEPKTQPSSGRQQPKPQPYAQSVQRVQPAEPEERVQTKTVLKKSELRAGMLWNEVLKEPRSSYWARRKKPRR